MQCKSLHKQMLSQNKNKNVYFFFIYQWLVLPSFKIILIGAGHIKSSFTNNDKVCSLYNSHTYHLYSQLLLSYQYSMPITIIYLSVIHKVHTKKLNLYP